MTSSLGRLSASRQQQQQQQQQQQHCGRNINAPLNLISPKIRAALSLLLIIIVVVYVLLTVSDIDITSIPQKYHHPQRCFSENENDTDTSIIGDNNKSSYYSGWRSKLFLWRSSHCDQEKETNTTITTTTNTTITNKTTTTTTTANNEGENMNNNNNNAASSMVQDNLTYIIPPSQQEQPPFAFAPVFGDNMVLQRAPSRAAIYGFVGPNNHNNKNHDNLSSSGVVIAITVSVYDNNQQDQQQQQQQKQYKKKLVFEKNVTNIGENATQQPFGRGYGVRPCTKQDCPPHGMPQFNPWNRPRVMWKILLDPPFPPGGNYTIIVTKRIITTPTTATTTTTNTVAASSATTAEENVDDGVETSIMKTTQNGNDKGDRDNDNGNGIDGDAVVVIHQINITNVTFGDVWYCSGQSNMWLPMEYTFSRNETIRSILLSQSSNSSNNNNNKYHNIRIMAGSSSNLPYGKPGGIFNPGYGGRGGSNPWMTAQQAAAAVGGKQNRAAATALLDNNTQHFDPPQDSPLMKFGATCWYFAQQLVDLLSIEAAEAATSTTNNNNNTAVIPIGLANTAIGGQRIELYMDNATIRRCHHRSEGLEYWNAERFAQQVLPFVDMTVKGWIWYQGENNMHATKGNSLANEGYGCELRELIQSWRRIWSVTPNTTDPEAPFGVVTLASSGSERGPNMGAMRYAQTANYGVLPTPFLKNTFLAQAYDLDDEWGPAAGRCFDPQWSCCSYDNHIQYNATTCNATLLQRCKNACEAAANTRVLMSGIHPRNKKQVGERLGTAAFHTVYGGRGAFTGPTLESCNVHTETKNNKQKKQSLVIQFNSSLLRGDSIVFNKIPPLHPFTDRHGQFAGGSQLYVQTDPKHFCIEPLESCPVKSLFAFRDSRQHQKRKNQKQCCPTWAGGSGQPVGKMLDHGWIMLPNLKMHTDTSIIADLSPLGGKTPTAVRYAWGVIDCCDYSDPDLYITHGCIASCPITSSSNNHLPANPFQAKIVAGHCECISPQVCSGTAEQ